MKAVLFAAAVLALPLAAAAAEPIVVNASQMTPLQARYCAKLREGVLPYVQFVRRTKPIYAYTYYDFAPEYDGAAVVADCRVSAQRVAELRRHLQVAALDADKR